MSLILSLETSTKACSVALSKDGDLIDSEEIVSEGFSHSENLTVFIERIFQRQDYELKHLNAVAVSAGPGSYTGLRIGCSTAKGLCYALDIPLIAISSLKALAALSESKTDLVCPMFDARRMEVYTAVYDQQLNEVSELEAKVLDESSFQELLNSKSMSILGPGAQKTTEIIKSQNAHFDLETVVSAKGMVKLAHEKYDAEDFVDTAYFEPNYLKDFIAGTPKKHF